MLGLENAHADVVTHVTTKCLAFRTTVEEIQSCLGVKS